MSILYIQQLLGFLLLVSLFHMIKTDRKTVSEKSENLSRQDKVMFREIADGAVKKTNIIGDGMDCYSCFTNTTLRSDDNCYDGVSMPHKQCADAEHCFTELHPLFIKRGCILPGRLNRTFICKCPLCNDKPAFDTSHYEYKKVSDWEYDNARLQLPIVGMDLMCKVCETKGTNPTSDKNCRYGKNADYMVCGRNQLCYTNIDDETDFVSRGCIDKPLYNSIYYFCNSSACNDDKFINPKQKLRFRTEQILLKEEPIGERKYKFKPPRFRNKTKRKSSPSSQLSFFMIILSMCLIFAKNIMFQV
ncbi:uncharacterized protein LOC113498242 isoform X2 [Trichoplusia ni]|uniref:Uncharacterized protein LOC113498242 isoform X2 n=1 Tax=Trichoplusia ni TaxID=7111 RepID=A0A7E5W076_TRINI|nr:uncharacterized protein LOC113498242 isoform X2 [Trichoplusia ni]